MKIFYLLMSLWMSDFSSLFFTFFNFFCNCAFSFDSISATKAYRLSNATWLNWVTSSRKRGSVTFSVFVWTTVFKDQNFTTSLRSRNHFRRIAIFQRISTPSLTHFRRATLGADLLWCMLDQFFFWS